MKTQSKFVFVSFALFCVSLFGANASSAQENKTLAQVQTQFAATQWEAVVDDGKAPRILQIKSISQESANTFSVEAKYGSSNEPLAPTTAKITQSDTGRTLTFITSSNNVVTAVEQPDGSFSGSFTSQKGKEKQVKLTKLQADSSPITPIAEGDVVTTQFSKPSQTGSQPVTFAPSGRGITKVHIAENGDRQYLANGQIALAYDKNLTTIMMNGKPETVRFVLFPQDKPLQPGMKWDVPAMQVPFPCGLIEMNFKAVSKTGPEVLIVINSQERKVSTIEVHYETSVTNSCAGSWKRTADIQYSPELNEVVGNKILTLDTRNFLVSGFNWEVTELRKAQKQIAGQ